MQRSIRVQAAIALIVAGIPIAACGHKKNEQSAAGSVAPPSGAQPTAIPATSYSAPAAGVDSTKAKSKHHSKHKGASSASHGAGHTATGAAGQQEGSKHKK